jgi:5-methyltetrahydrofolate--homocysteine methyltransferase
METTVSLEEQQVTIGPTHPFVVIGERINPTRRRTLAANMASGDYSQVKEDALLQVRAGAHVLDVNAGIPGADEPALLRAAVLAIMEVVRVPLCLDSANPEALASALSVYPGKALINSTTAEDKMMDAVFPLAKRYGAAVIGVITDERGVPPTARERLRVAERLIRRAEDYGVPASDVIVDPLALPVGADHDAARVTLDTIDLIRRNLCINMSFGASNVSFGLPDRRLINTAYLALAIARGLTSALTDPTAEEVQATLQACDLLMGQDENCRRWLKGYRAREKARKQEREVHMSGEHTLDAGRGPARQSAE